MAKVLLINSNRFKHPWPVIPFGLCCIGTALEADAQHSVQFLDLCFSSDCEEDIKEAIRKFGPDLIGISIRNIDDTGGYATHFLLEDVKNDVVDHCKNWFPGPIVIGGPSVGISGREMLDYFDLEYAISGDGEVAITDFAKRIETGQSPEGVEGLIIRREGTIIQDNGPARIQNLDTILFPRPLQWLDIKKYRRYGSPLHIQTKRGCALRCSYCTYNRIEGKEYRLRSPELVANEIEILVKETGINHVEFTDSIFNYPLSHAKEVLKELIRKNLNLRLHTMGLSPAAVDEELLDLMKSAGFNEVDIGAESTSNEILKNLTKNFKYEDIVNTSKLLKKKRIPVTWFIMLGALAETRETVIESLNNISKIASKWDLIFVSTGIRVYNGAPISKEFLKQNIQCTSDNFLHPVKIEPEKISLSEINIIAERFSFRFPNFYLYKKEQIKSGRVLIAANFLLKFFHSDQPVWILLILLKKIEMILGITLVKKVIYKLKRSSMRKKSLTERGFTLIKKIK